MQPQQVGQLINAAHSANNSGDYNAAAKRCKQVLQFFPDIPEAWYNLAISQIGLGKKGKAVEAFNKARELTLNSADAQNSIGLRLLELDEFSLAENCLKRAITLSPSNAFPYSNLGKLRERQGNYTDAESCFRKALELRPDLALLHANLGGILNALFRYAEAKIQCEHALKIDSTLAPAWIQLSAALYGLRRYEETVNACQKAIQLDPNLSIAWNTLGISLHELKQFRDAEQAFHKAIQLNSNYASAWNNLGNTLHALNDHEEAIRAFRNCLRLNPNSEFTLGQLLHSRMKICDWHAIEQDIAQLERKIGQGRKVANPFSVLGITGNPSIQHKAAQIWANAHSLQQELPTSASGQRQHDKIRIGYFSADFHNHATSYLMAEVFESHDRNRFELTGFSFGPTTNDAMQRRVSNAFDRFIDVKSLSDFEIAKLSRDLEIDIAVDLKGYTEGSRPNIFSLRAAPIQVSYLGYPGTMGMKSIDYLIADNTIVPETHLGHYSEKIIFLPGSYQVNDRKRSIADRAFTRSELGLPANGFVFCCFNDSYKITPETFQIWARILESVEGSVLWLLSDNPKTQANLRNEALALGLDPDRLIFAPRISVEDHLARQRAADLFLDTFPCNAHTTASDALWAGLPLLTCTGESFASRVAASLLNATGLSELVTSSPQEYEALAIQLAGNPDKLAAIRKHLNDNRLTAALFDTKSNTRFIEDAFVQIHERHLKGLEPEHIHVQPSGTSDRQM